MFFRYTIVRCIANVSVIVEWGQSLIGQGIYTVLELHKRIIYIFVTCGIFDQLPPCLILVIVLASAFMKAVRYW